MSFELSLLTPNGAVVKNVECSEILVPTEKGVLNVLANHTHIITKLSTGIMTVKTTQEKARNFLITTGVLKVLKNKITVLSMTSEKAEDIDQERAQKAKALAVEKLSGKDNLSDLELIKYQRKLERAEARLKLAYLR